MKLYEKILLSLVGLLFLAQLLPNFSGKAGYFLIAIWLLAFSYLVGGYWLLNTKGNKERFWPIFAGIAFAISLVSLPFLIRVRPHEAFYYFPILNGLLCIGLGAYLFVKRKTEKANPTLKNIFKRSLIILVISSFFTYAPSSFKPFRRTLKALNSGNEKLTNNLLTFDYSEEFEKALAKGDCDRAIDFAFEANRSARIWLGIKDSIEIKTNSIGETSPNSHQKSIEKTPLKSIPPSNPILSE